MAMLLDGPPSTIEDLNARDSDLRAVAVSEGIDLTVKLRLAAADVVQGVESMLAAAVSIPSFVRAPGIRHVAVTPSMKRWHTYASLKLIYQDLYFSRLNDRYQAKMNLYRGEEDEALDDLRVLGLGIVFDPLPQAPPPNVGSVASSDSGGTMYVAVALVNSKGEEGLVSIPTEVDTQDGTAATISMANLAANAAGWNLYAGIAPAQLSLQNSQLIDPLASESLAPGRLRNGLPPGDGQRANQLYPIPRRVLRG